MNDKFKFACKVGLSLTLAYLIPMAMGWPQASTAATTVMLIASTGSKRESLAKGSLRVLGTVVGAVLGLSLVGVFAQEQWLYMLSVSVIVSVIFYFRNAYTKDPTLFMLTGVMTLMMSNGGDAEGAFLYGIDRAYMTVFGVVIYTLVGTFLFPTKTEQNLRQLAADLKEKQQAVFAGIIHRQSLTPAQLDEFDDPLPELIKELFTTQSQLDQRYSLISKECSDVSAYKTEWDLALHYYKQITQQLVAVGQSSFDQHVDGEDFISNYQDAVEEINQLFSQLDDAWAEQQSHYIGSELKVDFEVDALKNAGHFEKGSAITLGFSLKSLHQKLSKLTEVVTCIDSVTERVSFDKPNINNTSRFIWWDAENFKTAIKVFVTYWVAAFIWIYLNPPGGYSFVIFSTIYMSLLSFMPVHPVMLLVLFTFGFLFAVPAYIFVLPNLTLGLELGVFIFLYTFIAFYLFNGPVTIFFLMGLFILNIDNTMFYHFGIVMTVMVLFYQVVLMIIFSHYFPFSSKPEHLFLVMRERLYRHIQHYLMSFSALEPNKFQRRKREFHLKILKFTVPKLKLWASKINLKLFPALSSESLIGFAAASEQLVNHLTILNVYEKSLHNNPLVNKARSQYPDDTLAEMATTLAGGKGKELLTAGFEQYQVDYAKGEKSLEHFFQQIDLTSISYQQIAEFYIFVCVKRNIFEAMNQCKDAYVAIDWDHLRQKRF
ncbi:FUSC family protein [Photobacterium damselae]